MIKDQQLHHEEVMRTGRVFPLSLWAIDVEKPENIGALFRLADALGIARIYLVGKSPDPDHKKIKRVARSTHQSVPWTHTTSEQAVASLKELLQGDDQCCIGLEITAQSEPLSELTKRLKLSNKHVHLLLGNENRGVPQEFLQLTQACTHITMHGQNSSMNVSMAAGIAAHWLIENL